MHYKTLQHSRGTSGNYFAEAKLLEQSKAFQVYLDHRSLASLAVSQQVQAVAFVQEILGSSLDKRAPTAGQDHDRVSKLDSGTVRVIEEMDGNEEKYSVVAVEVDNTAMYQVQSPGSILAHILHLVARRHQSVPLLQIAANRSDLKNQAIYPIPSCTSIFHLRTQSGLFPKIAPTSDSSIVL
jgi:hypothetical protein